MTDASDASANSAPSAPRLLVAGSGGWYAILAVSFLICSFNPIAAVALATGAITPREVYTTPRGWMLTGASFVLGAIGLALAERIAWRDRNRRALEISSILTCGASLLAFSVGRAVMTPLMYPIGALFVAIGAIGLWATRTLPDIGLTPRPGAINPIPPVAEEPARPAGSAEAGRPRRRKRRRHRHHRRTN